MQSAHRGKELSQRPAIHRGIAVERGKMIDSEKTVGRVDLFPGIIQWSQQIRAHGTKGTSGYIKVCKVFTECRCGES
jgi:hypothetical protein